LLNNPVQDYATQLTVVDLQFYILAMQRLLIGVAPRKVIDCGAKRELERNQKEADAADSRLPTSEAQLRNDSTVTNTVSLRQARGSGVHSRIAERAAVGHANQQLVACSRQRYAD